MADHNQEEIGMLISSTAAVIQNEYAHQNIMLYTLNIYRFYFKKMCLGRQGGSGS